MTAQVCKHLYYKHIRNATTRSTNRAITTSWLAAIKEKRESVSIQGLFDMNGICGLVDVIYDQITIFAEILQ